MRTVHGVGFDYRINTDQEYTVIKMKILLQHRILLGYTVLIAVIGSMAAIMFHERDRVGKIEGEMLRVREANRSINAAHRHITVLATYGESAISWTADDYESYKAYRLKTDSLLQSLKSPCSGFVRPEQIDTLCRLLAQKEKQLHGIMRVMHRQDASDSLLLHRPPSATRPAMRTRTVTRRKKGLAGLFGKKETVQVPLSPGSLQSLNTRLVSLQRERREDIGSHTDSLRIRNRELNRKLFALLGNISDHAQAAFRDREEQIAQAHQRSTSIITGLIIAAILLLVFSYLIIQKHLKRDSLLRKKMEGVIDRNNELLETRKNVILTISHDIRGPLNIIYGYVELAKDTRDRKRRNHHLENIETECKHILHLLNNLLDVYRLNESKETCNNVPFNLNDLLERIVTGFSHIANNKGIIFHHDSQNTDVVLCGDMDRISQIIDNLLTNAVKFTNAGMIQFNVRYENGMLYIEIKDTGIGMDQDTVSRIFRPFERLSSEANAEGFGLGLPITKGLVKLLGGSIDVESKIGHGSTFRVSLPLAVSNEKINSEASAVPQDRLPLPQRVLVIDNDTLQLEIAKEMLERNGVSCTTCSNAKELVNEMRRQDYDLLLSDIQMPETNGFEILALLRKSSIGNSHTIPIVAMTARGEGEKEAFIKGGFTDSIHKPFSMRELLDMVSSVVSRDVEESHTPDFATFTADVLDKRELLRTFIIQSEQNMADLQSAIKTGDIEKLHDIAHEIKPSLELLRADAPLVKLRTTLNDSACDMNTVNEQVKLLIGHISGLITEAEKEIKKMSDETEGTDS